MRHKLFWLSIKWKTYRCLLLHRLRSIEFGPRLGNCSNKLFCLMAISLMAAAVHGIYQLPVTISTEGKIRAGEVISDQEVPLVAESKRMQRVALEREQKLAQQRELEKYCASFGIDLHLARLVYNISRDEGLDPDLVFNIIWTESQFNPRAIGLVGEIGLMQIKYETALCIDRGATTKKLFDPAYNIRIGIKHLKDHLHFYRGDTRLALLAYNRGRGKVNSLLNLGENPSNGYARRVLKRNL